MKREIPQWVIEYNNANYQSSAGKAIKILMDENERMAELLKEHKAIIRELLRLLEQGGINPELKSILEAKKATESLKSQ